MKDKLTELIKKSMKEHNKISTDVYRSLLTDVVNAQKNGETDFIGVINKAKKKRLDSALAFQECGRGDLMEVELLEADIISKLLPKEPTDEEIMNCIRECCANVSIKMGEVIKYVKCNYPTVDGKKTANMVSSFLISTNYGE